MADKPVELLGWARNQVDEVVNIGGNNVFVTNKVEPTEELKDTGNLAREPFARSYLNWLINYIMRWIDNLDTRTSVVGSVQITSDATRTITDYQNEFGGTWVSHGSDIIAGLTVYVFERTV